jgi:hypothetical protein
VTILIGFALGLVVTALYAAMLVAVSWRLGVQRGQRWLPLAWLAGGLVFALLTLLKLRIQAGATIHFPPQVSFDWLALYGSFGYGLSGAGLTTLSVRKRLRTSPDGRLTRAAVAAGVGAFFVGMLLVFLVVAADDLRLLAQIVR